MYYKYKILEPGRVDAIGLFQVSRQTHHYEDMNANDSEKVIETTSVSESWQGIKAAREVISSIRIEYLSRITLPWRAVKFEFE